MTSLLRVTLACLAFSAAVPGLQATSSPSDAYEPDDQGTVSYDMCAPVHRLHEGGQG